MARAIYFLFFYASIFSVTNLVCGVDHNDTGRRAICSGNYTNTAVISVYQNNVQTLLSLLVSKSSSPHPTRFFTTSVGEDPPRAYGAYLCRGDTSARQCHNCLVEITEFLSVPEINNTACYGFLSNYRCVVYYANRSKVADEKEYWIYDEPVGVKVTTNSQQYNETLSQTLEMLVREAGYGNWTEPNFATRAVEVTGSDEKIYALVQCTPDISATNCSTCLRKLYQIIPSCCNGYQGGRLLHANCLMMYDNRPFFSRANHNHMLNYFHMMLILTTMYLAFV